MGARKRSAAAAAAQEHEDDGMGSGGEQVAAQPRRRAKLDTSDKVSCGSCGAKRCDPNVQWPEAPNDAGEVRRVGSGCTSCWDPFQRAFSNETTWTKHCAKQKGDAKYKKRVESAKEISKDPEKASFEQEEVNIVVEQGYTTIGNYVCIKPEQLEQQAGGGVTVGEADILTQRILAPLTKQKLRTICVAHPERPPVEVQTFTTVKCQKVACTLPRRAALTDAQAQVEMKKALAEVTKLLPVPLRGHVKPPGVESLVVPPAVGATGALGDGAAGGAVAACGSDVADSHADGDSSDEQGAAAEVASKAGPAASAAPTATPSRAPCQRAPRRGASRGVPSGHGGAASAVSVGRRGGGQLVVSPAAHADKLRLGELIHDNRVSQILDGYKMGDRVCALRRFTPQGRGVEINRVKHLANVDAAIALQKGIATMTAKQRAEQIEIIGNDDVLDSSSFLDQLICEIVGEADSGDDVVRAILPWAPADTDSATTFQLKRPMISFLRMSNLGKVVACRETFPNAFLAEVAAKGEASVNLVREVAEELRTESGIVLDEKEKHIEWVSVATALHVAAEALLVISDTRPNAVDQVTDRANVRKMLNGTFSKDWSLFRDSLMSNSHWARLTTEYLDHALSDLQVGPGIVAALAVVSVGSDLAAMVSASSRLKGWIDRSRTGAIADLEKAFAQWVVNATSADAAPTFTYESVGQIREVMSNLISAAKVKKSSGVLQVAALTAAEESMELAQTKVGVEKKRDSLLDRMGGCSTTEEEGDVEIRGMFELKTALSDLNGEALDAEDAAKISQQVETAMLCASVVHSDSRTAMLNTTSKLLARYKLCCNVAANMLSLTDIGDVGQQVASGERGRERWSVLSASLKQLDTPPPDCEEIGLVDGVPTVAEINDLCARQVQGARGAISAFVDEIGGAIETDVKKIQELIARLRGGMDDGTSWKDGLTDGDSYDEVHTHAKATLFKGKNGKLLNKALGDYKCATDEARKHGRKFNVMDRVNDLTEPFKATVAEASTTISEAALMQLMRKKPDERRDAVARELGAVADRGVSAAKLLAQIYEKAVGTKGTESLMANLLCLAPRHFIELPDRPWISHVHDAYGTANAFLSAAAKASGKQWRFAGPLCVSEWYGRREVWMLEDPAERGRV
ncbi:unnamed protein product [Prorocentrum cordatum]|uniref:Uncharacterized protein n=1 Tax=Prorocentrum cordatum TaxID=2364126 RepID=A0ABN9RW94_9DINO|nr:unnamed protein product [Polarella glacialis]